MLETTSLSVSPPRQAWQHRAQRTCPRGACTSSPSCASGWPGRSRCTAACGGRSGWHPTRPAPGSRRPARRHSLRCGCSLRCRWDTGLSPCCSDRTRRSCRCRHQSRSPQTSRRHWQGEPWRVAGPDSASLPANPRRASNRCELPGVSHGVGRLHESKQVDQAPRPNPLPPNNAVGRCDALPEHSKDTNVPVSLPKEVQNDFRLRQPGGSGRMQGPTAMCKLRQAERCDSQAISSPPRPCDGNPSWHLQGGMWRTERALHTLIAPPPSRALLSEALTSQLPATLSDPSGCERVQGGLPSHPHVDRSCNSQTNLATRRCRAAGDSRCGHAQRPRCHSPPAHSRSWHTSATLTLCKLPTKKRRAAGFRPRLPSGTSAPRASRQLPPLRGPRRRGLPRWRLTTKSTCRLTWTRRLS